MGMKREIVGVGALDDPYEMNKNVFEAAGASPRPTGHVE